MTLVQDGSSPSTNVIIKNQKVIMMTNYAFNTDRKSIETVINSLSKNPNINGWEKEFIKIKASKNIMMVAGSYQIIKCKNLVNYGRNTNMKTAFEILMVYGKCCVAESELASPKVYVDSDEGKKLRQRDLAKLENVRGQKKIIEWIFEKS